MAVQSNDKLARFHVDNIPPDATPELLAGHLGLMDMGRHVRVDLVIDKRTGTCGGKGVVTVPSTKTTYILSHNQLLFLGRRLQIQAIPVQILAEVTDKKNNAHVGQRKPETEGRAPPSSVTEKRTKPGHVLRGETLDSVDIENEPVVAKERTQTINGSKLTNQTHRNKIPLNHIVRYESAKTDLSTNRGLAQDVVLEKKFHTHPRQVASENKTAKTTAEAPRVGNCVRNLPYMYPMVDAAAILTHPKFQRDLPEVILRAQSVGVERIVALAMNLRKAHEARHLSAHYAGYIYWAAGVHPHEARSWNADSERNLEQLVNVPGCVAIGECGLDFVRDFSPREVQLKVCEAQVKLACRLQKPLILHVRKADNELREILNRYESTLPPTLVHCFSGSKQDALKYLAMGFYIGITGFVCKPHQSEGLRALLAEEELPMDKLILETDCPFMYPSPQGRMPPHVSHSLTEATLAVANMANSDRCEPCLLPVTLEVVAGFMKKDPMEVAQAAYRNAQQFYQFI